MNASLNSKPNFKHDKTDAKCLKCVSMAIITDLSDEKKAQVIINIFEREHPENIAVSSTQDLRLLFEYVGYCVEYKEGVELDEIAKRTAERDGYAIIPVTTQENNPDKHCVLFGGFVGKQIIYWAPDNKNEDWKQDTKLDFDKSRKLFDVSRKWTD